MVIILHSFRFLPSVVIVGASCCSVEFGSDDLVGLCVRLLHARGRCEMGLLLNPPTLLTAWS